MYILCCCSECTCSLCIDTVCNTCVVSGQAPGAFQVVQGSKSSSSATSSPTTSTTSTDSGISGEGVRGEGVRVYVYSSYIQHTQKNVLYLTVCNIHIIVNILQQSIVPYPSIAYL